MFLRHGFCKLAAQMLQVASLKTKKNHGADVGQVLQHIQATTVQNVHAILKIHTKSDPQHRQWMLTHLCGTPLFKHLLQVENLEISSKCWCNEGHTGKGVTVFFHAVWTYLLTGLVAGMLWTPNVPLQRNCLEGRTQWYIRGIDA